MRLFTEEELEELRLFDAIIDRTFVITKEEIELSNRIDSSILKSRRTKKKSRAWERNHPERAKEAQRQRSKAYYNAHKAEYAERRKREYAAKKAAKRKAELGWLA